MKMWTIVTTGALAAGLWVGCSLGAARQIREDGGADGGDAAPRCGNGVIDQGEVCDDGNTANGDDCRADCFQDMTLCGNGELDTGEACDDGNTVDGDGCSSTCQDGGCDSVTCPAGCCDPYGECRDGTQDEWCGSAGVACDACVYRNEICQDQGCQVPGSCTDGDTLDCGNCGVRTCIAGGWGSCEGQGDCPEGFVEHTGACGSCGTLQRVCQPDCTWSGLTCEGEGECDEGEQEVGASCGTCAAEVRVCQAGCVWGPWECVASSECTPGVVQQGAVCTMCGVEERVCQPDCSWGAYVCTGQGVCSQGQTQSCNDCGQRSCLADCSWESGCSGSGGTCSGSAVCDANGYCVLPCGNGVCEVGEDSYNCAADCPTFNCNMGWDNMCLCGVNAPGLLMTHCGGYCDPNCDGDFSDGDWYLGWCEYCDRCWHTGCP